MNDLVSSRSHDGLTKLLGQETCARHPMPPSDCNPFRGAGRSHRCGPGAGFLDRACSCRERRSGERGAGCCPADEAAAPATPQRPAAPPRPAASSCPPPTMTLAARPGMTNQAEGRQPMTSTRWRAAAILAPADITAVALATPAAGRAQLADGRGDRCLPTRFSYPDQICTAD